MVGSPLHPAADKLPQQRNAAIPTPRDTGAECSQTYCKPIIRSWNELHTQSRGEMISVSDLVSSFFLNLYRPAPQLMTIGLHQSETC